MENTEFCREPCDRSIMGQVGEYLVKSSSSSPEWFCVSTLGFGGDLDAPAQFQKDGKY